MAAVLKVLLAATFLGLVFGQNPLVELPLGTIQGSTKTSISEQPFMSFQGIPYARPPIRELRFKLPVPIEEPWEGILDGTVSPPMCPQANTNIDEDCLYLNVYRSGTSIETDKLLPVVFWIHGGGLVFGAGTYDSYGPLLFLDHEVVMVSINYRLGALGYFSLGLPEAPGNQGFWDQNLALKWVQENIEYFGGDPNQVMLFGESAGSWSVFNHLVSPASQGLFQKVILQSGTVDLGPAFLTQTPEFAEHNARDLAQAVGCTEEDPLELLQCMQAKSWQEILANTYAPDELDDGISPEGATLGYIGVVDASFMPEPFLPMDPVALIRAGSCNADSVIVGSTKEDGLLVTASLVNDPSLYEAVRNDWENYIPITLLASDPFLTEEEQADKVALAGRILDFYVGGPENIDEDHFAELTAMYTDGLMQYGAHAATRSLAALIDGPEVRQYVFSYSGEEHVMLNGNPDAAEYGVGHADDNLYLFRPYENFLEIDYNEADLDFAKRLVKLWVDFASGEDLGVAYNWTTIDLNKPVFQNKYMDLGPEFVMEMTGEYLSRMNFWEGEVPWAK